MRKNLVRIKHYSEDFKKTRVREYESGKHSALELSKLYGFTQQSMYRWIHKYSNLAKQNIMIVENNQSATEKLKEYEKQIQELQRIVGLKQIELDYLHKLIDIAQSEMGIDIKKNLNTPHSDSSSKTKDK